MRSFAILASIVSIALAFALACAAPARAQTWSAPRGRPVLWQIVAIDDSGEPGWPYGSEDIAGDGAASFDPDEAGADLRTVYADADADRLWIRAYVASEDAPAAPVVAYFFIDGDDRDSSGGDADDGDLWPELDADPTSGGYELAVAARGDGTLAGAWRWDAQAASWAEIAQPPPAGAVEVDSDVDPIRIGALERGYLQIALEHDVSGLDAGCDGNVFVRIWNDDPPERAFGDDDDQAAACRAPTDAFGDPAVLRDPACNDDADCPAEGICRDGVCLFAYDCAGDADCRTGEQCSAGECVRIVDRACDGDADCDGLVCDDGECAACAESGARACAAGLLCSPNGACVDPDGAPAGRGGTGGSSGRGGSGGSGAAGAPGTTRGGAFECATARVAPGLPPASWLLSCACAIALVLAGRLRRWRARSRRRAAGQTRATRCK